MWAKGYYSPNDMKIPGQERNLAYGNLKITSKITPFNHGRWVSLISFDNCRERNQNQTSLFGNPVIFIDLICFSFSKKDGREALTEFCEFLFSGGADFYFCSCFETSASISKLNLETVRNFLARNLKFASNILLCTSHLRNPIFQPSESLLSTIFHSQKKNRTPSI